MGELLNSTLETHGKQTPTQKSSSVFLMFLQISEFGGVLLGLSCLVYFEFCIENVVSKWNFTIRYVAYFEL